MGSLRSWCGLASYIALSEGGGGSLKSREPGVTRGDSAGAAPERSPVPLLIPRMRGFPQRRL